MYIDLKKSVVCTNLLGKEPVTERQKILPPRMQRMDPAQPMKRAAPSSYLKTITSWKYMYTVGANCIYHIYDFTDANKK